jgi:hypothetical protein
LNSGAAVPNPVQLKKATGPNPNNEVGHLNVDVTVNISKSGACEPLVVRFVPDPSADPTPKVETFNNSTQANIQKNSYDWRVGNRVLELVELTTPTETVRDTVTLVVVPAP